MTQKLAPGRFRRHKITDPLHKNRMASLTVCPGDASSTMDYIFGLGSANDMSAELRVKKYHTVDHNISTEPWG